MIKKNIYILTAMALLTGCESEWTGLASGTSYNFDMHAIMSGAYQDHHSTTVGPFETLQECESAIGRAEASLKSIMPERSFMTRYECCENAEWVTHLRIECTNIVHVPMPEKEAEAESVDSLEGEAATTESATNDQPTSP